MQTIGILAVYGNEVFARPPRRPTRPTGERRRTERSSLLLAIRRLLGGELDERPPFVPALHDYPY
jgi:hypothetical protein